MADNSSQNGNSFNAENQENNNENKNVDSLQENKKNIFIKILDWSKRSFLRLADYKFKITPLKIILLLIKIILLYIVIVIIWQIIAYFLYFIQLDIEYKREKRKAEKIFKNNPQSKNIDNLLEYKIFPAIVKLSENKILRIGGNITKITKDKQGSSYSTWQSNTAEIYNPSTRTSKKIDNMNYQRGSSLKTILLDNGKVLILGGDGRILQKNGEYKYYDFIKEIEIFDPVAEKFLVVDKLSYNVPQGKLFVTKLPDKKVLIIGENKYSIFDAKINKIIKNGQTPFESWYGNTGVLLNNGNVILTGRFFIKNKTGSKIMKSCYLYNPISDRFKLGPDMPIIKTSPEPTKLKNGNVVYTGGFSKDIDYTTDGESCLVQMYDYKNNKFKIIGKLLENRLDTKPILLPNNKIYIIGTNNISKELVPGLFFMLKSREVAAYPNVTCEIYDINKNFSEKTDICPISKLNYYQPIILQDNKILVFAELNLINENETYTSQVEILNIGKISNDVKSVGWV